MQIGRSKTNPREEIVKTIPANRITLETIEKTKDTFFSIQPCPYLLKTFLCLYFIGIDNILWLTMYNNRRNRFFQSSDLWFWNPISFSAGILIYLKPHLPILIPELSIISGICIEYMSEIQGALLTSWRLFSISTYMVGFSTHLAALQ